MRIPPRARRHADSAPVCPAPCGFRPVPGTMRIRPVPHAAWHPDAVLLPGTVDFDLLSQMPLPRSPGASSMKLATRRPVGSSGLEIPAVALGCGNFGGVGSAPEFFGQGLTEDQALELMDAAWEFGITPFRHRRRLRRRAQRARRSAAGSRSRGVRPLLTTKTFNPMLAGADHGLRPERIARQLARQPGPAGSRSGRPVPRARFRS